MSTAHPLDVPRGKVAAHLVPLTVNQPGLTPMTNVHKMGNYYPHAARWLGKAKQAYLQSGRKAEWLACFTRFKTTYARRPSLQKELAKL